MSPQRPPWRDICCVVAMLAKIRPAQRAVVEGTKEIKVRIKTKEG